MDRITMKGLQFYGHHGCTAHERKLGQRIEVDVTLKLDLSRAGESDNLKHTVNYVSVYELVSDVVLNNSCKLLEAIAAKVAKNILSKFEGVCEVEVSVRKYNPPIGGVSEFVEVSMLRKRE
ncbi:MAG: dihydroneopterin aldolase [Armatimonadota bacterium]|nr:dihydroneopterin aldolase [Armatimonadota bacterium]MCX7777750.1 dihydroneopterin aldolase [Armatimonadota bacterium]MDW8026196.1 dihydroneopterin aldolase [Armatimonadota bacterium]